MTTRQMAQDEGWILGWGRSPGAGNGNPSQYSCLENAMDRGAWWAPVHGVTNSQTMTEHTKTQDCLTKTVERSSF